jgi:glycosyltransferase involved in cell wall biosynthesis
MPSVSVIIPAYNAGEYLTQCLDALRASIVPPLEVILVDDGSSDDTRHRAQASFGLPFSLRVVTTGGRRGPGFARNLGSKQAAGDILFFLDSDVCVTPETIARIARTFTSDPALDALIGSYDRKPTYWNFLSQYRNLMHAYVHQTGEAQASTFWSGCGAVRREVFLAHGGFDGELYKRPAIEDIELGYRMVLHGRKILLDRELQVTHLKRWSLWSIVRTDILDRGIPWTELILRKHFMPNDLNLRLSQRFSVIVAFLLVAVTALLAARDGASLLIPLLAIFFLMLAGWWSEIRNMVRPRRVLVLLTCFVVLLAAEAWRHHMPALVVPLVLYPFFILAMRPSYVKDTTPAWSYSLSAFYIVASLAVAVLSIPPRPLLLLWFLLLALLTLLNLRFYLFLVEERRILFMLAAVPLHFAHHFYNGFSFMIGLGRHCWSQIRGKVRGQTSTPHTGIQRDCPSALQTASLPQAEPTEISER